MRATNGSASEKAINGAISSWLRHATGFFKGDDVRSNILNDDHLYESENPQLCSHEIDEAVDQDAFNGSYLTDSGESLDRSSHSSKSSKDDELANRMNPALWSFLANLRVKATKLHVFFFIIYPTVA